MTSKNTGYKKNRMIGKLDLYSLQEFLNPKTQFNIHSIVLIAIALFPLSLLGILSGQNNFLSGFSIFRVTYPPTEGQFYSLDSVLVLIILDLLISALILRPVKYVNQGFIVNSSKDFHHLIINRKITSGQVKTYSKYFFPRLLLYVSIVYSFINFFNPNTNPAIIGFYFVVLGFQIVLNLMLVVVFLITAIFIGLGLILEDYLREGSTYTTLQDLRSGLSSQAGELDKIIDWLYDPGRSGNRSTSVQYRRKIANSLFKLRDYLTIESEEKQSTVINENKKRKYVQAEKELAEELLSSLKQDKCVVCYAPLKNAKGELLVCPVCGQGGHKDHLDSWFATGKTECPICKSDLELNNYLQFSI